MEDHFLEQPIFGIPPEREYRNQHRTQKAYEFEEILEKVRQRPGEKAKIAVYKGSNRKKVYAEARASRARLWRFLLDRCPLEEWNLEIRRTPDTWCDRELWVRYRGLMTPEQALKLVSLRKDAFARDSFADLDPKARSEARAHARAMLTAHENRQWGSAVN